MLAGFRRLQDLVENFGIEGPLFKFACKPECDEDKCTGCPGFELVDKVVDQIADEGLAFMKQLQKEWIASHRGE